MTFKRLFVWQHCHTSYYFLKVCHQCITEQPLQFSRKLFSSPLAEIQQNQDSTISMSPRPPRAVQSVTELYIRLTHLFLQASIFSICSPGNDKFDMFHPLPRTWACCFHVSYIDVIFFSLQTLAKHLKPVEVWDRAPEAQTDTESLRQTTYLTRNYPSIVLHI